MIYLWGQNNNNTACIVMIAQQFPKETDDNWKKINIELSWNFEHRLWIYTHMYSIFHIALIAQKRMKK